MFNKPSFITNTKIADLISPPPCEYVEHLLNARAVLATMPNAQADLEFIDFELSRYGSCK